MKQICQLKPISSLEKVFADEPLKAAEINKLSVFLNEVGSFQVVYYLDEPRSRQDVRVEVQSALSEYITVRQVGLVPSDLPCFGDHDENVLRDIPGLYPDPLIPISGTITLYPHQWRSLWFTLKPNNQVESGEYPITVLLRADDGAILAQSDMTISILPCELPEQELLHTEWFHTDCLCNYYGFEAFSEEYWTCVENYIKAAVSHGINMILTPLFTPPLDTEVGGERLTVQLIDVEIREDGYHFAFDRLKRWIELCNRCGVKYFEFSHLFTQWGAEHAPKIIGIRNGKAERIFGWDTDAVGVEYVNFLNSFLPALKDFIEAEGIQERVYFHVSDEPNEEFEESYSKAASVLQKHLADYPVIDALSAFSFYQKGLVRKPIPSSNHIQPFLDAGVENLWTYYCVSQYKDVSNRFFCMPSARTRILGMQLYKYNIEGFLQWGFNFWNTQFSKKAIDPYRVTDAGGAFPSGDPFVVYPGDDYQPVASLRFEIMREVMQDIRALRLLESKIGREQTLSLLEDAGEITFNTYPTSAKWLLDKREQINQLIINAE